MLPPQKRCAFCYRLFRPDRRTAERQYACHEDSCQQQRKQANQRAWLAANPDYFEGRSVKHRAWRKAHPGYFAKYRQRHPEAAAKHRERERRRRQQVRMRDLPTPVAKQVEMPLQPAEQQNLAPALLPSVAIQDEILTQSPLLLGLIDRLQQCVAKPNHIDLSPEACYKDGLRVRSRLASRSASRG